MISVQGRTHGAALRAIFLLFLTAFASVGYAESLASSDHSSAVSTSEISALIAGAQPSHDVDVQPLSRADLIDGYGVTPLYNELQRAWIELARSVAAATESEDITLLSANNVQSNYQALQSLDVLYRHRLNVWLEDTRYPSSVKSQIQTQLSEYEDKTSGWHELVESWLQKAESSQNFSVSGFWFWLTDFYSRWELNALFNAVNEAALESSNRPILANESLPFFQAKTATPLILPEQPIVPVYAGGSEKQSTELDLSADEVAKLSDAIIAKAAALNYDPVKIFNFVQREISTEWYVGAMKGAERAMELGAANDVDSAALLVALLRASSVPARYETGVVRLPVTWLSQTLGVAEPSAQMQYLQRHGRALQPVTEGGKISAFDVEYVWVAALVPYANYRGAQVDKTGLVWVPLMPAVRDVVSPVEQDFFSLSELSGNALTDTYQSSDGLTSPLSWLSGLIEAALPADQLPALRAGALEPTFSSGPLTFLPASLPLEVRAVREEASALPENLVHRVRIVVRSGNESSAIILDKQIALADVDGQRFTLSYMPATRDVQNTVNKFGGIYTTPAWMVTLRPQLMLNGMRIAVGDGSIPMGEFHRVEIEFSAPFAQQTINRSWLSGGYYALSVVAQQIEEGVDYSARDVADTEFSGARLLSQLAARYNRNWLNDERRLSELTGYKVARPLPVLAIAANGYRREYVLDVLQALEWENVTLDAAFHVTEPVPISASAALSKAEWGRFSALQGSWRESDIFSTLFGVAAISADKGLRIANESGVDVVTLSDGALLPALALPIHVKADIERWLSRGFVVTTPTTEITYKDWSGSVWQVEDLSVGANGYFISGGLAGGAAAQNGWPHEMYQNAMQLMYEDPQLTKSKVDFIRKIGLGDWQKGKPLEEGEPLLVQVIDDYGHPIEGVPVYFNVILGDVELETESAITNVFGIAEVGLTFGRRVSAGQSYYVPPEAGENFGTYAGISLVDAWVTDVQSGIVHVNAPFHAVLYPGEASPAGSIMYAPFQQHTSGGLAGNFVLTARDEYGNAVSNAEFLAEYSYVPSGDGVLQPGGVSLKEDCPEPTVFCVETSATDITNALGSAVIQYVNGVGEGVQTIALKIDGKEFDSTTYNATGVRQFPYDPNIDRDVTNIELATTVSVSSGGTVNTAVLVGKEMDQHEKRVTITWPQMDWYVSGDRTYLSDTIHSFIPVSPGSGFGFTSDTMDVSYSYLGDGVFNLHITGGPSPALDSIRMKGNLSFSALAYWDNDIGPDVDGDGAPDGDYMSKPVQLPVDGVVVPGAVWVLQPTLEGVLSDHQDAPNSIILGKGYPDTYIASLTKVLTTLLPANYPVDTNVIRLETAGKSVAQSTANAGVETYLENGIPINTNQDYQLIYSVNGRLNSEPFDAPLFQPVITYPQDGYRFVSAIEVDIESEWSCTRGAQLGFTLAHPAEVTLEVDGDKIIDGEVMEPGYHRAESSAVGGVSEYVLTAVSQLDEHIETRSGQVVVSQQYNPLPIGHTVVEGVNVFNGGLNLNRTDFSLGGRGPGIEFNRFYSLAGSRAASPFGLGWGHSYNGYIQSLGCNAFQVAGGLGGGGRFYLESGEFRPAKGYHGTLTQNTGDNTFDFYSKDGTRYHYKNYAFDHSSRWSLEYVEDINGNKVSLTYDPTSNGGNLLSVGDASGRTLIFSYTDDRVIDGQNVSLVENISGPDGYQVDYLYDDYGRLLSATTQTGNGTQVESYAYPDYANGFEQLEDYYLRHSLQSITDPLGYVTAYEYEPLPFSVGEGEMLNFGVASITQSTLQNSSVSMSFDYSPRTNLSNAVTTEINNFRGDAVNYQMDGGGRVTSQSLPQIDYEWYSTDTLLKKRTEKYQGGDLVTSYEYDEHGNVTKETLNSHPAIIKEYYSPTAFSNGAVKNRIKNMTDRNGNVTSYRYDGKGNLERIDYPENVTESFLYASNGDKLKSIDGNGNSTSFYYDGNGYLARTTASDCCDMRATWSALGYRESSTDGLGNKTEYTNDALGRVLAIHYPEDVSESFVYDAAGNRTSHTNRNNVVVQWQYDEAGRVVKETWPVDGARTMVYDAHGNVVSETDFRGVTTAHAYDALDHRISSSTVGENQTRSVTYSVDEQGNVLSEDRGEGRITSYTYNDLNLATTVTDADMNDTLRSYDDQGNLTSQTNRRGAVTEYVYDDLNRLIEQREPLGRTLRWAYDGNGNVAKETDANGNSTLRTWSQHGQVKLLMVKDGSGKELTRQQSEFDNAGNLVERINSRFASTRYTYDGLNRRTAVIQPPPLGTIRYVAYDGEGNLLEERWPALSSGGNNAVVRQWDHRNRLLDERDALGLRRAYTYDKNGNVITEQDARGTTITRTWNDFNQLETESLPQHAEGDLLVSYDYDTLGNQRYRRVTDTLSDQPELVWETRYDVLNRATVNVDPLDQLQRTDYDAEGNPEVITNKRGNLTTNVYDALNRLVEVHEPLTRTRLLGYDPHGNLVQETDGRGITTRYRYDGLHRRTDTLRDEISVLKQVFDGEGNVFRATDANGNATTYQYNDANLLTQETGEEAAVTRFTWDALGNRLSQTDPENHVTRWTYDVRNRLIAQTNALQDTTQFEYDGNGNQTAKITANLTRWDYAYTLGNVLNTVTDPAGNVTTYTYDGRGNRLSAVDGEQQTTRWFYDALGRVQRKVYADDRYHSYLSYDANNNLLAQTDPNGQLMEHDYDALDRESVRRFYDANGTLDTTEHYTYDQNNNLTTVTETRSAQSWSTHHTYDRFDRLTHQQDRFGHTTQYTYDKNGNRTRLISSAGHATEYRYDRRNRVTGVVNADGENQYSYYRNSLLKKIRYASGASADYSYDAANRIKTITNRHNGAVVSSYGYDYDANGNRTQQTENNGFGEEVTGYAYDTADRLHQITYPDKTEQYTFDNAWNRLTEVVTDTAGGTVLSNKTLSYNDRHQLTNIDDSIDAANSATFDYDANGNQIEKIKNAVVSTFVYDARNHLRSATTGGSTVGQFLYDYRGLRTEKQGERGTERYSYDDQSVLFQSDHNNTPTANYEYGPNRLLSLKQPNLGSEFYLFDALRSPVTLIKQDGTITARYAYDAWGEKRHESGTSFNRFGFTGHEHDEETGLIYAKARYYDPDTARFTSEDPFAGTPDMPPSLHKYLYAYQNPTVWVDPDGRRACGAKEYASDCNEGTGARNNNKDYAPLREQVAKSTAPSSAEKEIGKCVAAGGSNCTFDYVDEPSKEGLYNQQIVEESSSTPAVDSTVDEMQQDTQRRAGSVRQIGSGVAIAGDIGASIVYWPKDVYEIAEKVSDLSVEEVQQYWQYLKENPKQAAENGALYAAVFAVCKGKKICGDGGGDDARTLARETQAVKVVEGVGGAQDAGKFVSGKGFNSFTALKRSLGPAGKNRAWHHIVEQTPANIKKFGVNSIQNTGNIVRISHGKGLLHQKISGFYSSKQPFTNGQTVRQWISEKSFDEQYDFGVKVLNKFNGL